MNSNICDVDTGREDHEVGLGAVSKEEQDSRQEQFHRCQKKPEFQFRYVQECQML